MIEATIADLRNSEGRRRVRSERGAAHRIGARGLIAGLKIAALGLTIIVFAVLAFVGPARADSLVLAQTGLVVGNQTAQYSINIPSAGTLDLQLTDFDWPSPMAALTLEIATPTQILQTRSGAGDLKLSLSGAGTYYAYVIGKAAGTLNLGAFGVLGTFQPLSPVPLPGSVSLLIAGMFALLWSMRRRHRSVGVPAFATG